MWAINSKPGIWVFRFSERRKTVENKPTFEKTRNLKIFLNFEDINP